MPKRPKYDPADDEPKVGDIWKLEELGRTLDYRWQYYLLTDEFDTHTFNMINLNTGEQRDIYMNFEVDNWSFHS